MLEQMKELTGRERLNYFLEYYGMRTAACLAGASLLFFLLVHFLMGKQMVTGILAVNTDGSQMTMTESREFDGFLEVQGVDSKRNAVLVNCKLQVPVDHLDDPVVRDHMQTVQTLFVTQAVDVFLAEERYFQMVAESDFLADLGTYLPQERLWQHEQDLVYVTDVVTETEILAGIRVRPDFLWRQKSGWYETEAVVGLSALPKDTELAVALLQEICN